MDVRQFIELMKPITDAIAGRDFDAALERDLNQAFSEQSDTFKLIEQSCHSAIEKGWMCAQGGEGRRFGRVVEPSPETHDLSIDVVDLKDIVGPHHRHPMGEICMVMPQDDGALFDGHESGWCVNPPGSAHRPTVTGGRALVLYFLPQGRIEFTEEASPTPAKPG